MNDTRFFWFLYVMAWYAGNIVTLFLAIVLMLDAAQDIYKKIDTTMLPWKLFFFGIALAFASIPTLVKLTCEIVASFK